MGDGMIEPDERWLVRSARSIKGHNGKHGIDYAPSSSTAAIPISRRQHLRKYPGQQRME
jgi:hypothetical protein